VAKPRTRDGYGQWLEERIPFASEPSTPFPLDERVIVGLRRREGVNMVELLADEGLGAAALGGLQTHLTPWVESGRLRIEGPRWRLSDPEGLAVSNSVLRDFLGWWMEQPAGQGCPVDGSIPAGPPPPTPDRPVRGEKTAVDDP